MREREKEWRVDLNNYYDNNNNKNDMRKKRRRWSKNKAKTKKWETSSRF